MNKTGIWGWLADRLTQVLEPAERDAVRGDLIELRCTGRQALRDVSGLILRRQAALWKDWRPWLAVLGVLGTAGVLLNQMAWVVTHTLERQLRTYWTYGVSYKNGLTIPEEVIVFVCHSFAAISWSWMAGIVLGPLLRRAMWVAVLLLTLAWIILAFTARVPLLFLWSFNAIFFLVPFVWGMRQSAGLGVPTFRAAMLIAAGTAAMMTLATWTSGWRQAGLEAWSEGALKAGVSWQTRLLPFAIMSWPAWYLLATAGARRWRGKLALLVGFAVMAPGQIMPADYPQWRGQNRDGSASAFSEPKSWPEKLTRGWKVPIGEGYATPILAGNTVYCFTRSDGNEVITALNAKNGKIQWQTRYPAPYAMFAATRAHGEGPKATPLFHNRKLYTLGISGIVSAFDAASGKLLWQKPAPAEQPFYGTAASPIGYKDLVIFHPGNYGPLTAFAANTGEVKWTAKGDGAYASPIVADLGGTRQIISMTQKTVAGISPEDGAMLWQHPWAPGMQTITPVLHSQTIILSGQNAGVSAIKPVNREGKWVVDSVWQTKDVSMFMSNPVLVRDILFGLSHRDSGQFFALDARTGKVLWLGQPREATNTAVVKAGNLLFLLNDDAELIVAKSSATGFDPIKRYTVADSATWAQPVISGNRVFIKDVSSLALWTLP